MRLKSKSQIDQPRNHLGEPRCPKCQGTGINRHYNCGCGNCDGQGYIRPIAKPRKPAQDESFSPDAPQAASEAPDVVISRDGARWCIINGHLHTPIAGVDAEDDPVMVAKYLAGKAAGPINVVWW